MIGLKAAQDVFEFSTISIWEHRKVGSSNIENRKFTRYVLNKPAALTLESSTAAPACTLLVHDISSGGALVSSSTQIPDDEELILGVRVAGQQNIFGRNEVEFLFRGKVVRREKSGRVAILFEEDHRINISLPT